MFVLRPSPIAGVGVFTTAPITEGGHLRLWQEEDWRYIPYSAAEQDPELRELAETYCVRDAEGYRCPLDFHRMSIGWYMNHSDSPNVHSSPDWNHEYYALRDIAAGEEIVCDYRALTPFESAPGEPLPMPGTRA